MTMTAAEPYTWSDGALCAPLETPYGPVVARFTTGQLNHAFVVIGELHKTAHLNDERRALEVSGNRYIGSVHLFAEPTDRDPHGWGPELRYGNKDCPEVHFTRWVRGTSDAAPRSHRDKILTAITAEVRALVVKHPEILSMVLLQSLRERLTSAEHSAAKLSQDYATALQKVEQIKRDLEMAGLLLPGQPVTGAEV